MSRARWKLGLSDRRKGAKGMQGLVPEIKLTRCLGPGPEHSFKSSGHPGHRLCPKCREAVKMIDVRPTYHLEVC